MTRMRWSILILLLLAGALSLGLFAQPHADARSRGISGFSGNPATSNGRDCTQCHSGGEEPDVTIEGPAILAPGETASFELIVEGGQEVAAGLDVSVTGGALGVPANNRDVQLLDEEIVHDGPKDVERGQVVFEYLFTAPDAPGTVTMYGAGNSVDLDGRTSGDMASTTMLEIVVQGGVVTPTATITPTATVTATATMTGTVEPTPTATEMMGSPTPVPTPIPLPGETLVDDMNAVLGLWWGEGLGVLVGEGGTGSADPGTFGPGNQDGAVRGFDPAMPSTIVDIAEGFANAIDPGGGIVGANHAIGSQAGGAPAVYAAQAGGPGHLEDARVAKIIRVGMTGEQEVFADTLAFEEENNPDGVPPEEGGIDSNPWRIVEQGERMYVVDAGGNDILTMDPSSGELGLWAVFGPLDPEQTQQPIPVGLAFDEGAGAADGDVAYVTLLGRFPPPDGSPGSGQIRRLEDINGDGDALDEGENELWADGLWLPMDLAFSPENGQLYVAELGFGRISTVSTDASDAMDDRVETVIEGIPALTAMIFTPDGDALVAATAFPPPPPASPVRAERVLRIPAEDLAPPPGETGLIYLPLTLRND